jgi:hypothetical protein
LPAEGTAKIQIFIYTFGRQRHSGLLWQLFARHQLNPVQGETEIGVAGHYSVVLVQDKKHIFIG